MVDLQRKIFRNVNILYSLCVRCVFWWFLPWDGQEMYKVLKHTCFALELFAMKATPVRRVTPSWDVYTANCHPGWQGYPTADRATRRGGSPHLSCKRDQGEIRSYMDRRVTPPRRVTSPTWGPPPPCKQAPRMTQYFIHILTFTFAYFMKRDPIIDEIYQ